MRSHLVQEINSKFCSVPKFPFTGNEGLGHIHCQVEFQFWVSLVSQLSVKAGKGFKNHRINTASVPGVLIFVQRTEAENLSALTGK